MKKQLNQILAGIAPRRPIDHALGAIQRRRVFLEYFHLTHALAFELTKRTGVRH